MAKERFTGKELNQKWNVGAKHALYRENGKWYHKLKEFPGALFDANGYVLFRTKEEFINNNYLQIVKDVNVPRGISSIPNYINMKELSLETFDVEDIRDLEFLLCCLYIFLLNIYYIHQK
jgi:5-methylcytosine-specific restriction protein A